MRHRPRVALLLIAAVTVLGLLVFTQLSTSDHSERRYVDSASVPGLGVIRGGLPKHGAAELPKTFPAVRDVTKRQLLELGRSSDRALRRNRAIRTSVGSPKSRTQLRREMQEAFFLYEAALACERPPRAAYLVLAYTFTGPTLTAQLNNLHSVRSVQPPGACGDRRVAVQRWGPNRILGDSAVLSARGVIESNAGGEWKSTQTDWFVVARRIEGRWRLSDFAANQPGVSD